MRLNWCKKVFSVLLFLPLSVLAVSEGDQSPEFTLPTLDQSQQVSLSSTNGKIRYVDFWASWCAPCRVSFPEIIKLQADLVDEDFEVIAITVDEDLAQANKFLRRYDVNYKILSDQHGTVAGQYELPGMPTSFVLDRQGKVRRVHSGYKPGDMDKIREVIKELLDEEPSE